MLLKNQLKNGVMTVTAVLVTLPVHAIGSSFSACTNNTISLPGSNGPEIWSCVSGNTPVAPKDGASLNSSNIQAAADQPDTTVSVEKRTDASSDEMKNQITEALDQPSIESKRRFLENYSIGLQYATTRKDEGLRESRDRSVVVPVSVGLNLTEKTNMSITVPVIQRGSELVDNSGVFNSDALGTGDISVNASSRVISETKTRPGLTVRLGLGIPTGKVENPQESSNLSLGSGFWSASAGATVSKRFDPATVFASIGYQHAVGDEQFGQKIQPGDSFEYSYGIGLSLNSALSVSGHIAGSIHRNASVDGQVIEGSNSEPLEFVSTSTLRLGKSTSLQSNLAFGLNNDASDARFGLTLTKDF